MVDLADLGAAADAAESQTIRVPRNVMRLLEQSYGSREKVLDWMLALGVAATMVWVFRGQLAAMVGSVDTDPNVDRAGPLKPNTDLAGAFPASQRRPDLYTYNMPSSRALRNNPAPGGTGVPQDPSAPPSYPQ